MGKKIKNNKNKKLLDNKIDEINLEIAAWTKEKLILQKCQYCFYGESINCLIGSSGSGKTTLLNYFSSINHLTDGIDFNCKVRVNNLKLGNVYDLQQEIGFVPQFEVIDRKLTPFEYYKYICKLLGIKNYKKKINEVLKIWNLTNIKNTIIGDSMKKGISGGELKRVSIGIQLLRKPKILILDEPTTGLDSESALTVLEYLKTLTNLGITVILSLHQPSNEIIKLIDNIIILSDGLCVYQGNKEKMNDHFKLIEDFNYDLVNFENILEYLDKDNLKIKLEKEGKINNINSEIDKLHKKKIKNLNNLTNNYIFEKSSNLRSFKLKKTKKKINFIKEFFYTLNFLTKCYFKDKVEVVLKMVQLFIFVGALYACYNDLGDYKKDTLAAIQNRAGIMYFAVFGLSHIGITASSKVFIPRRNIFFNEKYSNLHRNWIYYLCFQFYELPYLMLFQGVFSVAFILLFKLGENENFGYYFLIFYFTILLAMITSYSIGIIVNLFAKTLEQVSNVINLITLPWSMVVGFLCNIKDMAIHMRLLSYLSNFRFSFQNMILLAFEYQKEKKYCYIYEKICPYNKKISCSVKYDFKVFKSCDPFNYYDFKQGYKENFIYLVSFLVILRVIGLIIFLLKFNNKKIKNKKIPKKYK